MGILASASCAGEPPVAPSAAISATNGGAASDQDVAPAIQPASVSMSDVSDARIVFAELQEQVRIATAKLHEDALGRKREMGGLGALVEATDAQMKLLSAKVQRLDERLRQLRQDAFP
jgi:hypothetical protein